MVIINTIKPVTIITIL